MSRALVLLVLLMAAMTGCYGSEDAVLTLRLSGDSEPLLVEIERTYHVIHSDASPGDTTGARDDFEKLMERWLSDDRGLEAAFKHRYLKERRLWVEGGRLHGTERVIAYANDFMREESEWTADSTGFYLQLSDSSDSSGTTNGTFIGGRWYWPPEARLLIVRAQVPPSDQGHWRAEFAKWYQVHVAEHGLDEYGHKVGPASPGSPRR